MSILVVQLGDIHILAKSDGILGMAPRIAAAVVADAPPDLESCCILMSGDAVQNGTPQEFHLASTFLLAVKQELSSRLKLADITFLSIPGNHDVCLEGDQSARDTLLSRINSAELPAKSIADIALAPLHNYFEFSKTVCSSASGLSETQPFFATARIQATTGSIDFHLVNTSWMCCRGQKPGALFYPVDCFCPSTSPATFTIAALHHPFNWFSQPSTMRELRERVEQSSDMIITGHEHSNAAYAKTPLGASTSLQYVEGGVLQERSDPNISSFTVLVFDFVSRTQRIIRLKAGSDCIYRREFGSSTQELRFNTNRRDKRFQLTEAFRAFLDDPDLPLADARQRPIRLLDIFTYPDLRESSGSDLDREWKRIKGESVLVELSKRSRVLISGTPKSGKTSLAKCLFADLLSLGQLPLYINGNDFAGRTNDDDIRKRVDRAVGEQYLVGDAEAYNQLTDGKKALILDNFHEIDNSRGDRARALKVLESRFDKILAITDDELLVEQLPSDKDLSQHLADYSRLDICEFGHLRIEQLAKRWLACSESGDGLDQDKTVKKVCKSIGQVLQLNAIPHHPWVLLVLIQQARAGQDIAAKNGSYGHLYQAIITSALSRSLHNGDIETMYVYLSELAYTMYCKEVGTLDSAEMHTFHNSHCDKYDLELIYDTVVPDLLRINLLRSDSGRISFRTKYSYWFFVAWYLSRHIHESRTKDIVSTLCKAVHHEDTANVFVFLAHLSNDPFILDTITASAEGLFAGAPLANLIEDTEKFNALQESDLTVYLPESDPEENRRKALEEKDEEIVNRDGSATDGRKVNPSQSPDKSAGMDDISIYLRELQASMKTIEILGQVLRNGAGSITSAEKQNLIERTYKLGRRVLGNFLDALHRGLPDWGGALLQLFRSKFPDDTPQTRFVRVVNHIIQSVFVTVFVTVRRVSHSVAHEMLRRSFERVLYLDSSIPNRLFDLSIKLEIGHGMPSNEAEQLFKEFPRNTIARAVVRVLVANHLYLYKVDHRERQAICEKLGIKLEDKAFDPELKRVGGVVSSTKDSGRGDLRKIERQRKKEERKRRKRR